MIWPNMIFFYKIHKQKERKKKKTKVYVCVCYNMCLCIVFRWLVMFVLETALYLTMSQAMLYLKNPDVPQRDKQLLKRELGTEMV